MSDPILRMQAIGKTFGPVRALGDVTMDVVEGEIHAICGENGAGKSTLMNVLSGLYPYGTYEGEIVFEGREMRFRSLRDSEAEGIVIIHQELGLSPFLSIGENIFLGNERARAGVIDWAATNGEARDLLARVGLRERPDTRVKDIGVGKQQLVEIAKALSKNVKLLILDEPTAALNDEDSAHLLGLMRTLKAEGMTQIIISHKLNEVMAIADSITIVRDGSVVESMDNTQTGPDRVTEGRIIRSMVGRSLDNRFPERDVPIGEELLRLEDWTVYHPDDTSRVVVEGAALDVRAGEVVGIAGLMGAGRTELAMSVFGHQYGSRISGQVYLHGRQIDTSTVPRAIANGLAYVSEDRKKYGLNLIAEIRHNISGAALRKVSRRGVIDKPRENAVARDYRDKMRIRSSSIQQRVGNLSGGNQQKVVLSKWMFTEPEVLILDEPTRGIDVGAKYEIYQIINELAATGRGVIVISSELPELLGVCDRIYALSEGRITGQVARAEATQESLMELMTMEAARA
ncbi:multiple monosaccharide ABC transporter ATP-binding protein [Tessaracoccus defluvii]|uniref:Sugar ABC transporter ATP-binding protein n=1 Tax=Tessaracoccus defluvii TaxID=1285901 RepID=A0A7H0H3V3_9ACTN|nr:multiple monosaccharide ABC transporter ATP-binding protein [Tessaracoccus defluvii]QNP55219.1 sugar ABC transporter ATP-binding protein [Tessaracoccus defluvii]